jgi:uncharacterized protein YlxP (DUF503 family)
VVVGVCRLSLYFPESGSLKTKRQGLRRVIDRVRAKFNAAVAEVSGQDTWQRSGVGIVVVGNDGRHVQSMLDNIVSFVEQLYVAQVLDRESEILHYGDELAPEGLDMP